MLEELDVSKYKLSDIDNYRDHYKKLFEHHTLGITELGEIFNKKIENEIGYKVYGSELGGISSWSINMIFWVDACKNFQVTDSSQKFMAELKESDDEYKIVKALNESIDQLGIDPIRWSDVSPKYIQISYREYFQWMRETFIGIYIEDIDNEAHGILSNKIKFYIRWRYDVGRTLYLMYKTNEDRKKAEANGETTKTLEFIKMWIKSRDFYNLFPEDMNEVVEITDREDPETRKNMMVICGNNCRPFDYPLWE